VEAARREAEAAAEAEDAAAAIGSNDGDEADLADDGDEIEDGGETGSLIDDAAPVAPLAGRGTVVRKVSTSTGPSIT
ncbi:hypothetical protein G6O43_24450, partial [Salmonella enterica subsp. enterica serovar 4:-:1,2]|nr:hypothetical protein [Salmonella enterica subsp. enterica serovar 4:-:1,2]